jgi:hypothetical protein
LKDLELRISVLTEVMQIIDIRHLNN